MYELISTNLVSILGVLGMLAFAVSLITQLIKDLPGIEKVPTKLLVMIISLVVCTAGLFGYGAYEGIAVLWYYIMLAVFTSFVVSYISFYGWDTFTELYNRFAKVDALINSANDTAEQTAKSTDKADEKTANRY